MYDLAASSGSILLPPLSVVPSGSLKDNKCVDDSGRLLSCREVDSADASPRPWIRGTNSRLSEGTSGGGDGAQL